MIKNYLVSNAHRYASKWLVLAIDVVLISISFVLAYIIRFNLTFEFKSEDLFIQLPIVAVIAILSFMFTESYKGVVRHTGVRDVYKIFNAICLSSILTIFLVIVNRQFVFVENFTIPLGIIIIHSLLAFIALIASRYIFKTAFFNLVKKFKVTKNVLIYGAGESGILTYNALTNQTSSNARVVAYLDDDPKKIGKIINGVMVLGKDVLSEYFLSSKDISEIIVSINNVDADELRELVESLVEFPVQVKIVPPVDSWINGELKVSQIKQVQIEDLLDRSPIDIKKSKVSEQLKNQVILVTGGAGSIGSEIVRQIANYDYKSLIIR